MLVPPAFDEFVCQLSALPYIGAPKAVLTPTLVDKKANMTSVQVCSVSESRTYSTNGIMYVYSHTLLCMYILTPCTPTLIDK